MSFKPEEEIPRILQLGKAKFPDAIQILNLDLAEVTEFSEVGKRYRKLALQMHPDKCKLPHAAEAFKVLEDAYRKISDEHAFARLRSAALKKKDRLAKEGSKRPRDDDQGMESGTVSMDLSAEERLMKAKLERAEKDKAEALRRAQKAAEEKARRVEREKDRAAVDEFVAKNAEEWQQYCQ